MASIGSTRIAQLWPKLSAEDRARAALLFEESVSAEELVELLSSPAYIQDRVESLDEGLMILLEDILFEPGLIFESLHDETSAQLEALAATGLIFPARGENTITGWVVPFEVRLALIEEDDLAEADLAVLFTTYEPEELDALAHLHDCALNPADSHEAHAETVALSLLDANHLDELLHSLMPSSRSLVQWLIQHEGPVASHVVEEWLTDVRPSDEEAPAASTHVLLRLGLVQSFAFHDVELLTIATDLRAAMLPILSEFFDQECTHTWTELRDHHQVSFRDNYPRGLGGAPLHHARYRLLRAIAGSPDPTDAVDRLLCEFYILDTEKRTSGELASYFLDVSTSEAYARHLLRVWTRSLSDLYTTLMIRALGGDSEKVAQWLTQRMAEPDPESLDPLGTVEQQLWSETLVQFRGLLVVALGALQDGTWYSMDRLANFAIALYRRTLWQFGRFHLFSEAFPWEALPVGTEELTEGHAEALRQALDIVFATLFEPIGAAQRDASGKLFVINNEAFRIFRDTDPSFDGIWEAAESILGEDVDVWLPLPVEMGLPAPGQLTPVWDNDGSLLMPIDAPLADLVRVAEWADPYAEGTQLRFRFSANSFTGDDTDEELEQLLLWLVVRTQKPLNEHFRMLVPLTTSAADGTVEQAFAAARTYVAQAYNALDAWAEAPALSLMEELRAWGVAAEQFLSLELRLLVEDRNFDDPRMRHIAVLFGELGTTAAHNALHEAFLGCKAEIQEGAIGTALARLGEVALPAMVRVFHDATMGVDKRLAAAGTLASMAILHPHLSDQVFQEIRRAVRDEEIGDDFATILCAHCAEMGHREAEHLIRELRDQGRWLDDVLPFDDALWIANISPAVWGHPIYGAPIAQIFPNRWESEEFLRLSGVDAVIAENELENEPLIGRAGNWRRRG